MNIPALTAKIAALPYDVRHIVAGSMAFRLSNVERDDLGPLWRMSRDHPRPHHPWPSTSIIRSAFIRVGVPVSIYRTLVNRYDDFLPEPRQYQARRDNVKIDGTANSYTPVEDAAIKALYEFCPPPEML